MAKLVIFGELGSEEVKWNIPNFIKQQKEFEDNSSAEYSFLPLDLSEKCTLKMFKHELNNGIDASKYVTVYLHKGDANQAEIKSELSVERYGGGWGFRRMEFAIGTRKSGQVCKDLLFPRRVKLNDVVDFIRGGNDNYISVVWTPGKISTSSDPKPLAQPAAVDNVADDLEKAFSNKQFSDIQLLCKGEKFDCHRVILAARSPVFAAMFNHDMKENINKEVKLDSMEPKILKV